MTQYLLSVYQPDGPVPPPAALEKIMQEVAAVNDEIKAAGAWVFTGGLRPPDTATVLQPAARRAGDSSVTTQAGPGTEVLTTDGPYVEGKEHLGGFTIVETDELESALRWGRKLSQATGLPIEVRPFRDGG